MTKIYRKYFLNHQTISLILRKKYLDYLTLKKISQLNLIKNILQIFLESAEINPTCAFFGGIVSEEALKIMGKYTPMNQRFRFRFFLDYWKFSN